MVNISTYLEIRKVQITKLHLNKTSRDEQHFSLAFQASSRRVLVSKVGCVFPMVIISILEEFG